MRAALFAGEQEAPPLAAEEMPAVWEALEGLCALDVDARRAALDALQRRDAVRRSRLVACFLVSRLEEPDMPLRGALIRALAAALGGEARAEVRQALRAELRRLRRRPISALLQAAARQPEAASAVGRLLGANPYAGNTLVDILTDRAMPLPVRQQAARFIGQVGFLDARPVLERLARRLESRQRAQVQMPFAPRRWLPEEGLFPAVREALLALRAAV